ncbi:MAG TPA: ATP synthase F1 subunit epsilon [Lacipirellulaceae bacterium]
MPDHSTPTGSLRCLVVTPETTVVDTLADAVTVTLVDGEYGIAPRHAPMIGRLGYGELRIRVGAEQERYYTDGGFVQVVDDVVSVLTNRAMTAASLTTATATEQLRAALARPAAGNEELAIRDRLIAQSRGQLRVAQSAN